MQTRINRKLLIIKKLQKLTLIDMAKKASILHFLNSSTFGLLYVHGLGASKAPKGIDVLSVLGE